MIYRKGNKIIEISHFEPYKRKCLFIGKGNKVYKVASFQSDFCADEFEKFMDEFLGIDKKGDGNE